MDKAQLIINVSSRTGVNIDDVRKVIEASNVEIKQSLSKKEGVYMRGFGSFIPKLQKAKIGRNISKGTFVVVPERIKPAFKPSNEFVNMLATA